MVSITNTRGSPPKLPWIGPSELATGCASSPNAMPQLAVKASQLWRRAKAFRSRSRKAHDRVYRRDTRSATGQRVDLVDCRPAPTARRPKAQRTPKQPRAVPRRALICAATKPEWRRPGTGPHYPSRRWRHAADGRSSGELGGFSSCPRMAGSNSHGQPTDHGCLQRMLSNVRSRSSTMIVRGAPLLSSGPISPCRGRRENRTAVAQSRRDAEGEEAHQVARPSQKPDLFHYAMPTPAISAKILARVGAPTPLLSMGWWCRGVELNHRRKDFQSFALPTELPRQKGPPF